MVKIAIGLMVVMLVSCATAPKTKVLSFDIKRSSELYNLPQWSFLGRIAVVDKDNAISAKIAWEHSRNEEKIELSGAFGLGRTKIHLTENGVKIETTKEFIDKEGDVNLIVSAILGVDIPVSSLKYWVLGAVDPDQSYVLHPAGFDQNGWRVRYLQMESVEGVEMPRKIRVLKDSTKLKLIVSRWDLKSP